MEIRKATGFTLFELLVSVSIIGIISALAMVSYSGSQMRARNARRMADMDAIQRTAEQYYAAHHNYPINQAAFLNTIVGTGMASGNSGVVTAVKDQLVGWPTDPKNTGQYIYAYYAPGTWASAASYCACALMEGTNQGNSSNICANFVNPNPKNYYCVKGIMQ